MIKQATKVYFIPWGERDRLPELLEKSGAAGHFKSRDLTAIKMHFGEKGNNGYTRPELVRLVIKWLREKKARPFLTDTGTIYHGQRSNAVSHLELAASHGFTQTKLQVPVVIADGLRGGDWEEIEIDGRHFKKVKIATGILNADSMIVLSHFKGHIVAGFGGALKNLGMGCGARQGKFAMHSSISPDINLSFCTGCAACAAKCAHGALKIVNKKISLDKAKCVGCGECVLYCDYNALSLAWNEGTAAVQERFAEYAAGAIKGKRVFFVNFLNHITPNCDCLSKGETPLLPDIGIVASSDPVAIDQASYDLVVKNGGDVFKEAHPSVDSSVQLVHAERLMIGSRKYELVEL